MARPKKYNIDKKQVQNLARLGCTNIEIAEFFGCDESLIRHSYSEFLTKGRSEQKLRLRQLQWSSAEKGNIVMQIFLGKNILGQTDKIETTHSEKPLPWSYD
jgi:hypothetical protein|tara:strand:- start:46 stop:351 length:306 start_codon:yes stop_codon:yes gene_type:complete